jgi:hypothetical protein
LEWVGTEGEKRAESITIIEIVANQIPTGGRPVLLNVGNIQCIKIKGEI